MGDMSDFTNEMQESDFLNESDYQYDYDAEAAACRRYTGLSYQEEKDAMQHMYEEGF